MQRLALAMISFDSASPHAPSFSCQAFGLTGSYARLCHSESAQGQSLGRKRNYSDLTGLNLHKQNRFRGENSINRVPINFLSVYAKLSS